MGDHLIFPGASTFVEYKYKLGHGLHRIRKGHPIIYQVFREEWDALLVECMQGLSRKERR